MKRWLLFAITPYLLLLISAYGEGEWRIITYLCGCYSFATATIHYDKIFNASSLIRNKTLRKAFLAPYSISAIFLYSMGVIPPPTKLTL